MFQNQEDQDQDQEEHVPINVIEPDDSDDDDDEQHSALQLLQLNSRQFDSDNEFNIDLFSGYIEDLPSIVECPVCLENIPLENVVKLQCE